MITPSINIRILCSYLFSFTLLLGVSACNKGGAGSENGQEAIDEKSLTHTDSTFVEEYLKREKFIDEDTLVRKFYYERDYKLAWFRNNKLIPQANRFIEAINTADREGLDPKQYQHKDFNSLYEELQKLPKNSPERDKKQAELDLALTGIYFTYSRDYYRGLVDPREQRSIAWKVKKNKFKPIKALQTILKERESRYPYYEFAPLHQDYDRLRNALSQYREIKEKGGWPEISGINKLKKGDSSEIVPILRQRLQAQLKVGPPAANPLVFDESLETAVKEFQEMHGLKPDGVVGGNTLKTMNVSVDNRIDQIILNMERWRWVPKRLPERHILVNVPEYHLYAVENGKRVLDMKVIVGKTMTSTPVFSDKLEYIVFSPYWNITENILFTEVIPAQIRNPNFMPSQDMEVVKDLGKNKVAIIPLHEIDWSNVSKDDFKYRVRQRPGRINPLGKVKFIFPNSFDVYLHDTPNNQLFSQSSREFSHGCIRIAKPFEMAQYLLRDKPEWDDTRIRQAMNANSEQHVSLKEKIPVYIVYFTSWVDSSGRINFRNDIYGHDQQLAQAYF